MPYITPNIPTDNYNVWIDEAGPVMDIRAMRLQAEAHTRRDIEELDRQRARLYYNNVYDRPNPQDRPDTIGTYGLTMNQMIYNARIALERNTLPEGTWEYNAYNASIRQFRYDPATVVTVDLETERKLRMDLNNTEDKDMTDSIEVELADSVNMAIIENITKFSKSKAQEIQYCETKIKESSKEKFPDKQHREKVIETWQTRLENVLTMLRLCEKLAEKFTSAKRPFKLQKNERKVLANVIGDISLDFSMLCPHSKIGNINHPDRFFGFPSLEKKVKRRIAELNDSITNLTRSDTNVYVK